MSSLYPSKRSLTLVGEGCASPLTDKIRNIFRNVKPYFHPLLWLTLAKKVRILRVRLLSRRSHRHTQAAIYGFLGNFPNKKIFTLWLDFWHKTSYITSELRNSSQPRRQAIGLQRGSASTGPICFGRIILTPNKIK